MKTAISDSKDFQTLSPVNKLPGEQSSSRRVHLFAISSLFAIGALVYGTFIRSVGFYWDDWPVVWVYNELGSQGLTTYFTGNRPYSGWLYGRLDPYQGISPVGWQVANDIVRWGAAGGRGGGGGGRGPGRGGGAGGGAAGV